MLNLFNSARIMECEQVIASARRIEIPHISLHKVTLQKLQMRNLCDLP